MRYPRSAFLPLASVAVGLLSVASPTQELLVALGGRDPVALCDGRDVAGRKDLTEDHFLYSYRFADEQSRAEFRRDPERFGIQWGGACGRMGPLSGRGAPERYLVHDGRIYLFASEQCRDAFAKNPAQFIGAAPPPLEASTAAKHLAAETLRRAAAAIGDPAVLRALQSVRFERQSTAKSKDGDRQDTWCETIAFPADVHQVQTWGDWKATTVAAGGDGFVVGNSGDVSPLHASGVHELRQSALVQPLVLLRHHDQADFVAAHAGAEELDGRAVDLIDVQWREVRTTLVIARDNGAVVEQRYRGRGSRATVGDIVQSFSDFRAVGGLELPHTVATKFNGVDQGAATYTAITPDPELPADFFRRPG